MILRRGGPPFPLEDRNATTSAPRSGRAHRLIRGPAMQNRRSFFSTLTSFALALPFASGIAARAAAAPPPAFLPEEFFPKEFFIVNGWVLTRADLIALDIDAL